VVIEERIEEIKKERLVELLRELLEASRDLDADIIILK
jgi:hypothetical protein